MGLPISVHLRGPAVTSTEAEQQVANAFEDLRRADEVFSTYRPDSQISRWERGDLALADADPALSDVLALCEQARQRTEGSFDARSLPDPIGTGLRFDPSGLVKGWAVQQAAHHLAALDSHDWCVNAGGDVMVSTAAGGPAWRVGIEDPTDPTQVLQVVSIAAGAVATSGSAHRGAHLIDPIRHEPATAVLAVTVVGPNLLWCDVYATAAAVRGAAAVAWLTGVPGYEALVVHPGGHLDATPGWPGT